MGEIDTNSRTLYDARTRRALTPEDLQLSEEEYQAAVEASIELDKPRKGVVRVRGRRVYAR